MASRQQDFITEARQNARKLWDALNSLEALQHEWQALDYATSLEPGAGENDKLLRANIGSVIFDTTNAIRVLMNGGHATNIATLL